MIIRGIGRRFSAKNNSQFEEIGAMWDSLAAIHGRENLIGIGWNWHEDGFDYVFSCPGNDLPEWEGLERYEVELPEAGWQVIEGKSEDLEAIYQSVWSEARLLYEIEQFFEDGSCRISYFRK